MNTRSKNPGGNSKSSSSKASSHATSMAQSSSAKSTAVSKKRKRASDSSDTLTLSGSDLAEFISFQKSKKQQGSRAAQTKNAKAEKDRDTQRQLS